MGVLAVVMLVDPDLLENVAGAALVLGAAAALTVSAILLRAGADRLRGGSGPRRPVGGRAHRHP
jgi:drug/metabolite transporter (DMT)-like permease